jgi:hypothetical protein
VGVKNRRREELMQNLFLKNLPTAILLITLMFNREAEISEFASDEAK